MTKQIEKLELAILLSDVLKLLYVLIARLLRAVRHYEIIFLPLNANLPACLFQ